MVLIPFETGVVRELKESDVSKLDAMASEKAILDFYFINDEERKQEFQRAIRRNFKSARRVRDKYDLAVEEKGEVKGYLSLKLWPFFYHGEKHFTDVSYFIGKNYRRKGIAERVLTASIPFIFDEMNTERLSSICLASNIPSKNLLEKLGLNQTWKGKDPEGHEVIRYQIVSKEFEEKRELVYTG
jgi:RimJ/RimL family protein N-acetyltransferase